MGQMEKEGMKNQNSKGDQAPMLAIKEENENNENEDLQDQRMLGIYVLILK